MAGWQHAKEIADWSCCCDYMDDCAPSLGMYYRPTSSMLKTPMRSNAFKLHTFEACKWESFCMTLDERKEDYTLLYLHTHLAQHLLLQGYLL